MSSHLDSTKIAIAEEDRRLVHLAQKGDLRATETLLRAHHARLYALCRRIVGPHDADDATQEALIAIARGLANFDGRSSFVTWSYRVATNACLDEIRKRQRRTSHELLQDQSDIATSAHINEARARESNPPIDVERVVDHIDLDTALTALSIEQRMAVVLRDLCGCSYEEIATVLQVPPGTVRSRIARGRSQLRDYLAGNPETSSQRQSSQP